MHNIIISILLLTAVAYGNPTPVSMSPKSPTLAYTQTLAKTTATLLHTFDKLLKDPFGYDVQAIRECGMFPEGRIYPFAIPALGYANLAISGKVKKEYAILQMRKLIDLMLPHVSRDVHAPDEDLTRLRSYRHQGTLLSTLNLVLTCYAMVSDDGRYADIHDTVSRVLYEALEEADGRPIASYPEYTWNFDTIMALASLWYYKDSSLSEGTRDLLRRHLAWREKHATHEATGLPLAFRGEEPRGCDLSMQICLMAQMDMAFAQQMYAKYIRSHWLDLGFAAGFSEWPRGSAKSIMEDIDSGPVFFGIGATATGIGVATALSMQDEKRVQRLVGELPLIPMAVRMLKTVGMKSPPLPWFRNLRGFNDKYTTGFLYGDCMMLYALSWTPYSIPAQHK